MNIVMDIDLTICKAEVINGKGDYVNAKPILPVINKSNKLYDEGINIILYTARGMRTFKNDVSKIEEFHRPILEKWLNQNNVKYNELVFGKLWKPDYYFVDDRSLTINQFIEIQPKEFKNQLTENKSLL